MRPQETPSAAVERLKAEKEANQGGPSRIPTALPLGAIEVEPSAFQVREEVRENGPSPDRVEEIASGLDGSKLDEPVHVWWTGLRWVVIEGHHRHAAYGLLEDKMTGTLKVPVVAHSDISLSEAMGLAGRLNSREKIKISKPEMLDNAWRMVCIGEGSIKQQSSRSAVSQATISNMRGVRAQLFGRGMLVSQMLDAGWKQCLAWSKGRTHRDHSPEGLEAMARELAEELKNLRVTSILKSPDVLARALAIVSPALPGRLLESDPFADVLNTSGRTLLAELDAESMEEVEEF